MPIYEYRCTQCDHRWSATASVGEHERDRPTCPECRSTAVEQVFTPFFAKTIRKS
jgi:putative FmdB family regulatory protein